MKTNVFVNFLRLFLATACIMSSLYSYAPTNFFRPFDVDFRQHEWGKNNWRVGALAEFGKTSKGRDWDENKNNVLQLYDATQSSVAMLLGAPANSTIYNIANGLGISSATITADSTRGKFVLTGEYEEQDVTLFCKYKLPELIDGTFEAALYIPFKSVKYKNVCWQDQTLDTLMADKIFKDDISGQIEQKALDLGRLNINKTGYKKTGLGDMVLMLKWHKDYEQEKDFLKWVRVKAQVGVSMPTGEKKDQDQSLSLPLGNDGAWGIPASLGLDLNFIWHLRAGIQLDFFGIFNRTGEYRMRTSRHQTDYLLLHKGTATKSQGASWKFTLFGQAKKIFKGLSAMVSYHFEKHDEDRLSPKSYDFDYAIVNTAENMKEWATHSFAFQATYDLFGLESKRKYKPQISAFYKLPITGKRAILAHTFGAQIGFSF